MIETEIYKEEKLPEEMDSLAKTTLLLALATSAWFASASCNHVDCDKEPPKVVFNSNIPPCPTPLMNEAPLWCPYNYQLLNLNGWTRVCKPTACFETNRPIFIRDSSLCIEHMDSSSSVWKYCTNDQLRNHNYKFQTCTKKMIVPKFEYLQLFWGAIFVDDLFFIVPTREYFMTRDGSAIVCRDDYYHTTDAVTKNFTIPWCIPMTGFKIKNTLKSVNNLLKNGHFIVAEHKTADIACIETSVSISKCWNIKQLSFNQFRIDENHTLINNKNPSEKYFFGNYFLNLNETLVYLCADNENVNNNSKNKSSSVISREISIPPYEGRPKCASPSMTEAPLWCPMNYQLLYLNEWTEICRPASCVQVHQISEWITKYDVCFEKIDYQAKNFVICSHNAFKNHSPQFRKCPKIYLNESQYELNTDSSLKNIRYSEGVDLSDYFVNGNKTAMVCSREHHDKNISEMTIVLPWCIPIPASNSETQKEVITNLQKAGHSVLAEDTSRQTVCLRTSNRMSQCENVIQVKFTDFTIDKNKTLTLTESINEQYNFGDYFLTGNKTFAYLCADEKIPAILSENPIQKLVDDSVFLSKRKKDEETPRCPRPLMSEAPRLWCPPNYALFYYLNSWIQLCRPVACYEEKRIISYVPKGVCIEHVDYDKKIIKYCAHNAFRNHSPKFRKCPKISLNKSQYKHSYWGEIENNRYGDEVPLSDYFLNADKTVMVCSKEYRDKNVSDLMTTLPWCIPISTVNNTSQKEMINHFKRAGYSVLAEDSREEAVCVETSTTISQCERFTQLKFTEVRIDSNMTMTSGNSLHDQQYKIGEYFFDVNKTFVYLCADQNVPATTSQNRFEQIFDDKHFLLNDYDDEQETPRCSKPLMQEAPLWCPPNYTLLHLDGWIRLCRPAACVEMTRILSYVKEGVCIEHIDYNSSTVKYCSDNGFRNHSPTFRKCLKINLNGSEYEEYFGTIIQNRRYSITLSLQDYFYKDNNTVVVCSKEYDNNISDMITELPWCIPISDTDNATQKEMINILIKEGHLILAENKTEGTVCVETSKTLSQCENVTQLNYTDVRIDSKLTITLGNSLKKQKYKFGEYLLSSNETFVYICTDHKTPALLSEIKTKLIVNDTILSHDDEEETPPCTRPLTKKPSFWCPPNYNLLYLNGWIQLCRPVACVEVKKSRKYNEYIGDICIDYVDFNSEIVRYCTNNTFRNHHPNFRKCPKININQSQYQQFKSGGIWYDRYTTSVPLSDFFLNDYNKTAVVCATEYDDINDSNVISALPWCIPIPESNKTFQKEIIINLKNAGHSVLDEDIITSTVCIKTSTNMSQCENVTQLDITDVDMDSNLTITIKHLITAQHYKFGDYFVDFDNKFIYLCTDQNILAMLSTNSTWMLYDDSKYLQTHQERPQCPSSLQETQEESSWVNYLGAACLLSFACLLVTFVAHIVLPNLNYRHTKSLLCFTTCFMIGYAARALRYFYPTFQNDDVNITLFIFNYIFNLTPYFWLNVLSFDMWRDFSRVKRDLRRQKKSIKVRVMRIKIMYFNHNPLMLHL